MHGCFLVGSKTRACYCEIECCPCKVGLELECAIIVLESFICFAGIGERGAKTVEEMRVLGSDGIHDQLGFTRSKYVPLTSGLTDKADIKQSPALSYSSDALKSTPKAI